MYESDYAGFITNAFDYSGQNWNSVIYAYIKPNLANGATCISIDKIDRTKIYCPVAVNSNYMFTSYAMNNFAGGYNWNNVSLMPKRVNAMLVPGPSCIYLAGEKNPNARNGGYRISSGSKFTDPLSKYTIDEANSEYDSCIALRHNLGSEWLFFDGHVEHANGKDIMTWDFWTRRGGNLYLYYR
jgi:prepilin-type processing-associated H-X9-DG protein